MASTISSARSAEMPDRMAHSRTSSRSVSSAPESNIESRTGAALPVLFVAVSSLCHRASQQASVYRDGQVLNHSAHISEDSAALTGGPAGSEIPGWARAVSGGKGLPVRHEIFGPNEAATRLATGAPRAHLQTLAWARLCALTSAPM